MGAAITAPAWTPAEDATVRSLFGTMTAAEIAARLPGRNQDAVWHRTRRLGLIKCRRWTPSDDKSLRAWWGEPLRKVARELGRTVLTVYWRAYNLGLPLGVPEGGEYINTAAKRCGYDLKTFRGVMKWAGVKVHRVITRRVGKVKNGRHWVDSEEATAAVERWHKTETPEAASRRYHVEGETIVRRLLVSGLPLPTRPRKAPWRIETTTIDQAMAMVEKRGRRLVATARAK